jgi:transcriptional regulator with XRE-family HTH domain
MKERILQIMKLEELSSSAFAEEIGIQRAAMSHITSGRNNPSLDVYAKILERFTYINPDWLLSGKGNMRRDSKSAIQVIQPPDLFANPSHIQPEKKNIPEFRKDIKDKKPDNPPKITENEPVKCAEMPAKKVARITVFYSDNTYETCIPEKVL